MSSVNALGDGRASLRVDLRIYNLYVRRAAILQA